MIRTNNHWRPFRYRNEVPALVLADQFDYQAEDVLDGFFRYRGSWYHLDQFTVLAIDGWDGSLADSAFSGVVIKLSRDGEHYKVGRWTR
jgi:hypothetical protein